jgi:hypothetical protein
MNTNAVTHHVLDDGGHQRRKEGSDGDTKLLAGVPRPTTEDTPEDITASDIVGHASVTEGESQGSDVIRNNTVSSVNSVNILRSELSSVIPSTSQLLDFGEYGGEDVGVVVGALILDDGYETLEAHASVDVLGGEGLERAVGFTVELDENVVPDFEYIGVVLIDEVGGVTTADTIEVDFAVIWLKLVQRKRVGALTCKDRKDR